MRPRRDILSSRTTFDSMGRGLRLGRLKCVCWVALWSETWLPNEFKITLTTSCTVPFETVNESLKVAEEFKVGDKIAAIEDPE